MLQTLYANTTTKKRWMVLHLSGVLVFYPGADIRVQREVWSKVLEILCKDTRGAGWKESREVRKGEQKYYFETVLINLFQKMDLKVENACL